MTNGILRECVISHWSTVICHLWKGRKGAPSGAPAGFKKGKIELNDLSLLVQHTYQTQGSSKFNKLVQRAYPFVYKTDKLCSTSYRFLTVKTGPVSKFRRPPRK